MQPDEGKVIIGYTGCVVRNVFNKCCNTFRCENY